MAERPARSYFQRSIVRWETYRDPADGREYIRAAVLSCGHRYEYAKRRPAGSKRTSAPCAPCGSGSRIEQEHRREERAWRVAVFNACRQRETFDHLVEFVELGMSLLGRAPSSSEAERIRDQMDRAARLAGLRIDAGYTSGRED